VREDPHREGADELHDDRARPVDDHRRDARIQPTQRAAEHAAADNGQREPRSVAHPGRRPERGGATATR
jgi:hypothetical protein